MTTGWLEELLKRQEKTINADVSHTLQLHTRDLGALD